MPNEKTAPDTPHEREKVGEVLDTETHEKIPVVPREHESPNGAIDRVQDKHVK